MHDYHTLRRANAVKVAESVLRDWANPNSFSSGTLRASAQDLLECDDLLFLDPRLREKLVEIANGDR